MKLVKMRRLKEAGLRWMQEFIESFDGETPLSIHDAKAVLASESASEELPTAVDVDQEKVFSRRFDLAEYLHHRVPELGLPDATRDSGLWAWLALLWFDQLAPVQNGERKVGETAKWIPETGWKYYRHLVLGPYLLFLSNEDRPERALVLLGNPPHTPGEIVGQLAATQDVVQSKAAVGAATALYYDPVRRTFKKGTAGRGPGSAARFRTVLDQFDRTVDLQSISERQLLDLLPSEFAKFRK